VPIVLKSGNLNFLEPSEPVQACNGIALPLHMTNNDAGSILVAIESNGKIISVYVCNESQGMSQEAVFSL
jgi:hypothetical protein